jgi:hypothetical protein
MARARAERRNRRTGARFARRTALVSLLVAALLVAGSIHAAELCTAARHAAGSAACAAHEKGLQSGATRTAGDGSTEHRAPRRAPCCSASVALSGVETKRIEGMPGGGARLNAPFSALAAVRSRALDPSSAPSLLDARRPDPAARARRRSYLENGILIL